MIQVLYFAGLREALGLSREEVVLPGGSGPVTALMAHLVARGEPWTALATAKNLRVAVNQSMAPMHAVVSDGGEVAFFPPVTGG